MVAPKLTARHKTVQERDASMLSDYVGGKSFNRLVKDYGLSLTHVARTLRRMGAPIKPAIYRKYALNEAAFDNAAQNPEAQYWIGFLLGDGCLMKHVSKVKGRNKKKVQYCTVLSLTQSDSGHLISFRDFLGSNQPIGQECVGGYPNSKTSLRLTISSRRIFDALARYGLTPRKSMTAKVIGLENSVHFWRGCVDADGYLMYRRANGKCYPAVGLVGPMCLLRQFAGFMQSIDPQIPATIHPLHQIWKVEAYGRRGIKVIRALYDNDAIALPRKKMVANQTFAWVPKKNQYC
jgi:hypothetical protein